MHPCQCTDLKCASYKAQSLPYAAVVAGSDRPLATSGQEAGRLVALLATVSLCKGLLQAMVMPCSHSVTLPERVSESMRQAGRHKYYQTLLPKGRYSWIKPALECTRLPTNGSICKRVHIMQTLGGDAVRLTYTPAPMHAAMSTPYTAVSLTVSCLVACLG